MGSQLEEEENLKFTEEKGSEGPSARRRVEDPSPSYPALSSPAPIGVRAGFDVWVGSGYPSPPGATAPRFPPVTSGFRGRSGGCWQPLCGARLGGSVEVGRCLPAPARLEGLEVLRDEAGEAW